MGYFFTPIYIKKMGAEEKDKKETISIFYITITILISQNKNRKTIEN